MEKISPLIADLAGYISAVPTPFLSARIDEAAFEAFCAWQIERGISGLVICGTTGEAPTLSGDEQHRLVRLAARVANGRVPVIAGIGTNATARAIEMARNAASAGAHGLLAVVPYYNKPTQDGMYRHFCAIHEATELPVILYDVPSRTGCGLAVETIARLSKLPRVVGLKDATGDLGRLPHIRRLVGPRFRLFSGDDATALGFLAQGGDGCVSVTSNVAPAQCVRLHTAWEAGDVTTAQQYFLDLADLTFALFAESNPIPVKFALSLLGRMSPKVRSPLCEAVASTRVALGRALLQLQLVDQKMRAVNGTTAPAFADNPAELAYR